ncbi:MAG: CDP-glucose 4,6-dehydratase [Gammaproteobacteria bacterium]|nr:CDP-glucose 4,6-dehydratase [Gammaproteobacteria bacterium]
MSPAFPQPAFWAGKSVFVTGHTGFKGGWLSLWLQQLGARVHGYSLEPPTQPNLFTVANVERGMASSTIADIEDAGSLDAAMRSAQPDVVFHLAAQPLVRLSYAEPVATFATNVMGTVNLFEAVRKCGSVKTIVNVTSDKCYENREWVWPYREDEAMGGFDPYSSSKACSEIVTAAYRRSFLATDNVGCSSARAGNVIGGGDWAADRLLPDFFRALDAGMPLVIRSPNAVRPWQHVLEPLSGYLLLAERLTDEPRQFAEGWNFGPADSDARPVSWIVERLTAARVGASWQLDSEPQLHEANHLKLDSSKARTRLSWRPRWQLETALSMTGDWHDAWRNGEDMHAVTLAQIAVYLESA